MGAKTTKDIAPGDRATTTAESAERRAGSMRPGDEFGQILKVWRQRRGISQLKLAQITGLSSRHICFLEQSRAMPRRHTALELANALDVPERELPMFLAAAGFSHHADATALSEASMRPLCESLEFVLRHHNPFPAAVVDLCWNVPLKNLSYRRFLRAVRDEYGLLSPTDTFFHPNGLRRCNTNWEDTVAFAAQRIHGEILRGRTQLTDALDRLTGYPGIPTDWRTRQVLTDSQPMLNVDIALNGQQLQFFAAFTTFWTVNGSREQDIGIMSWFPRDNATEDYCIQHFSV